MRSEEEVGGCCNPRKNTGLTQAAALGVEGLIVPHLSCKNRGIRLRNLVGYPDVTGGPWDIIGLGLWRKVNCSDHTV